jgi:hypothetical protein
MMELLEDRSLLSVFTVTDLGDKGTGFELQGDLRYCLNQANANDESSNQIQFQPGLTGTIILTQGSLDVTKDLEIAGPGQDLLTISGDHHSGVFNITADPRVQAVSIADLTIADGTGIRVGSSNQGGGLFNDHATVTLSDVLVTGNAVASGGYGGGIASLTGTMILNSSTVSGNSVARNGFGGGIGAAFRSTLILNSSTVSGNSIGNGDYGAGGGIAAGGQEGLVIINSSLIEDNHVDVRQLGDGGGIELGGPATISDSTISGNSAGGFGGGIAARVNFLRYNPITVTRSAVLDNRAAFGGGIFNFSATFTIDHTIVSGNSTVGRFGSGLDNADGRMTITDSIISDNTGGSAIFNDGQMTISGSTISGNSTPSYGGGLYADLGSVTIVNSTFSGNTAGAAAGAIFMVDSSQAIGVVQLTSVTITGNVAPYGGGLEAPLTAHTQAHAVVRNTLIAGNSATYLGPDVIGVVTSLGYNVVGKADDSRGWTFTDSLGHSFAPLDPVLGPLQDNGGPTPTHALLAGSPAIETGDPGLLGSYDQRGTIRIHNGLNPPVDVGAFDAGVRYRLRVDAPAEVVAGEPFAVTVVAVDAFGFKVSTFTETTRFSSSDGDAVLPPDHLFAPEDAGEVTFSVTLQTEGSQELVVTDIDFAPIRTSTTITVDPPAASGKPLAAFADLFFSEADPIDSWTPVPGRKRARATRG